MSFSVFAITVSSSAQLRKVHMVFLVVVVGGGAIQTCLFDVTDKENSRLINGLELEHSTCTP